MKSAGLVDLQVNGFAGVDFNSATITAAEVDRALEAMLATGVTTCLPTVITAYPDELAARFAALDAAVAASRLGPAMCPGYHLEGPFINPAPGYRGCHPFEAMTPADPALVPRLEAGLTRPILMVTIAPEIEGALPLIARLAGEGRVVALGHTAADFAQVEAAAAAGATLSTHLGNGSAPSLPKLANPIFAQLAEDRLMASFIADGIHLPPRALKAMLRAKGIERAILVTDAVAGAAARPGRYTLGSLAIERHDDGSVRLAGSTALAGAALLLDEAVRNVVAWGLADAGTALAMASTNAMAALAPALARFGIPVPDSEVAWSDDLRAEHVRIGPVERRYDSARSA